jgi:hypothetical protein
MIARVIPLMVLQILSVLTTKPPSWGLFLLDYFRGCSILELVGFTYKKYILDKGKPTESWGRKATGAKVLGRCQPVAGPSI